MGKFNSKKKKRLSSPSAWLALLEGRAIIDAASLIPALPWLNKTPDGDGHPVLVLPGFLANSKSTALLRKFLSNKGYASHRWKLGINTGYSPELEVQMQQRVMELADRYGRKVSLIGWSLGGVYARELARELPETVRSVITMGSPFRNTSTGTNVRWLYNVISEFDPDTLGEDFLDKISRPPPVPTTAIFSKTDGIAAWHTSCERIAHPEVENIIVKGSHIGLGFNPRALIAIGDRLAQPEGQWKPFQPKGTFRLFYQKVENIHTVGLRQLDRVAADLDETLDKLNKAVR